MPDETKPTRAASASPAPAEAPAAPARAKLELSTEAQVALLNQIAAGIPRSEGVEEQAMKLARLYRKALLLVTTGEAGE